METISLIDALLPEREDAENTGEKALIKTEIEKRTLFSEQSKIAYIAEKILPRIFNVYENNISNSIRTKALQIIDKLILLFSEELLNNFIEPYSFAKFIYSNLHTTTHLPSLLLCLQMIDKLMKSNPKAYTLPLMREGVTPFIKNLSSVPSIEKQFGINFSAETASADTRNNEDQIFLEQAKRILMQSTAGTNKLDEENQKL